MSDTINVAGGEFPLEQTLCKDCVHRLSKIIIPINYEDFGIDIDEIEDPDDELEITQHTCLKTGQDMDYIVVTCSQYQGYGPGGLLRHNI
jgi:hypothetical protein